MGFSLKFDLRSGLLCKIYSLYLAVICGLFLIVLLDDETSRIDYDYFLIV